jgi:deazaflavin-dependent oxidoreductase (nitroreductase family)
MSSGGKPAWGQAITPRPDETSRAREPRLPGHAAFADLEHVGRRSGAVRHTPVRAFRTGDTVTIGLNFGRQSDGYQNIKAAGTCCIRLGGGQLTLGAPVLVPAGQSTRDMPWLFGFTLRHVVHTAECVQLPVLHSVGAPAGPSYRTGQHEA